MKKIEIVKNNGERELFDSSKLKKSLVRAGATVFVANDIIEKIEKELVDGMTTTQIYKRAFAILKKKEERSAVRYSLRRSILSLGPTGFPFEEFISSVFKAKGYETINGQTIDGKCVSHEVDIIAHNDKELLFAEAKFHNEAGTKSDTKVALYIKARFDDLADSIIKVNGLDRKMTRGILITNTKFTENSKKYGRCADTYDMISWDYPEKGNLYDLIEETGMHPMTCIPQLSNHDKQELLKRGIATCTSLKDNVKAMKEIGMNDKKISGIVDNIEIICSHNHLK